MSKASRPSRAVPCLHESTANVNRRQVLAAGGAAVALAAPLAAAATMLRPPSGGEKTTEETNMADGNFITAQDLDPHAAWFRELRQLDDAYPEVFDAAAEDALSAKQNELRDKIATTPARTLAGVAIQAQLMAEPIDEDTEEFDGDHAALRLIADTLARMAAAPGSSISFGYIAT
jgi:hypothetical protein